MKPINNYVLIKVDEPEDKIGSLYIPDTSKIRINKGVILAFDEKLKNVLQVGSIVFFWEYTGQEGTEFQSTHWIDKDTICTPYTSLNCVISQTMENGNPKVPALQATGSKILVRINKEEQESNRFVGKLLMAEWNSKFAYHNQSGICLSVGENVKDGIQVGDMALFSHFTEGQDHSLIQKLENGDEIRVLECGTSMTYELFGFINHKEEIISTPNYLFVEENEKENLWDINEANNGLFVTEGMKRRSALNKFKVSYSNASFNKGDTVLSRGQSVNIGKSKIKYIHNKLIECKLIPTENNEFEIHPIGERIIVLKEEVINQTPGGIIMLENKAIKSRSGTVSAMGPKVEGITIGDKVEFGKDSGIDITVNDKDYLLMPQTSVFYAKK